MFRHYAYFSTYHPLLHKMNIIFILCLFSLSVYQLLANEALEYAIGLFITLITVVIFAKSSTYKSKYLTNK